ncbi:hypothetical protein, no similarity [Maudiozyma saulgeensis]|uniref:Uncharacterized protein n=1 Tax=Maudiozyma saulgeensis TaxID=1789683 RepID=A0A1X7R0T8_9SACH|nr:hypothetical protein, no similarity [Kazachstania saulgeensis]
MHTSKRYSHVRTFSNEAIAAATTATSGELSSRTSSLVRSKSVPRHTHSFRRTASIMSDPESRRSHRRVNSYGISGRTFSTSIIPTDYDESQIIDANMAFDNFDGSTDEMNENNIYPPQRRYRHISNGGMQLQQPKYLEVVEKYVPGPRGLSIVQVPVIKQSSQKLRKDYPQQQLLSSPTRSVSDYTSSERASLSPKTLKRHGAVRRSKIAHSSEDSRLPISPHHSMREVEPVSPRDFHATYEDGINMIEKTVTTRQTKDHGSVETTTIIRRHTKKETKPDLVVSNNTNDHTSNTKENVLKLRAEVKKSELEEKQLELELEKIKIAEMTLTTQKENHNLENEVKIQVPSSVIKPKYQHEKLKGPIKVVKKTTNYPRNVDDDSSNEGEGNFSGDNESTSIVSSMVYDDHLSTIQSIEVEPTKQESQPRKHDLQKDTSNQDIKILNGKLNEFLDKEMVEEDNDFGNGVSYESLLMNTSTTEPIPGTSSKFNSKISLDLNDSQISVVPSLDLGQGEHEEIKISETKVPSESRHHPSMAQYLKASHPYLISSDEELENGQENSTYLSHSNDTERRISFDTDSNIDSTLSINLPHGRIPTSSYTSVDSHSKSERILNMGNKDLTKPFLNISSTEANIKHSKSSQTTVNGSQSTGISSSIDVPGSFKNNNADTTVNSFKSESSSVYSYHPTKNVNQPRIIRLDNLGETLGEFNHMRGSSLDEKKLVLSKREERGKGHKSHRISQSVDLDMHKDSTRRRSEKISTFNGQVQVRSKSLTRRLSFQSTLKNINNIENETFKKHSRNSSISKSLKKMFGIHSK